MQMLIVIVLLLLLHTNLSYKSIKSVYFNKNKDFYSNINTELNYKSKYHINNIINHDNNKVDLKLILKSFKNIAALAIVPLIIGMFNSDSVLSSDYVSVQSTITKSQAKDSPTDAMEIVRDRLNMLKAGVTGEKVSEIRVGESLVRRLRSIEQELNQIQEDIYSDEKIDWDVVSIYPKIFRSYSPLFTAYTDRAFPFNNDVDKSLRYALRYEVGGFYNGVRDFEEGVEKKSQRQCQRAFAKISLSYDRYFKAGDLYLTYSDDDTSSTFYYGSEYDKSIDKLSYIAPSIEAPALQDEVVLLKGPDKSRKGVVLWIAKGDNLQTTNVVVKFQSSTSSGHQEVKLYPYTFVAKTTPPEVQFLDGFLAAYIASAISCGIMYPIDTYKTRIQVGQPGVPNPEEGGFLSLWKGVLFFVADANDAVYLASYGFIKPLFLSPIDPNNAVLVFSALVISGSVGDAFGSVFRLPMEIVYKRIQTDLSTNGISVLLSFGKAIPIRVLLYAWFAILLRDMPFAGLQIALFDIYKNLLSFLDEYGVSSFTQNAIWGILAGGTAAAITTPFDVLTTNILTAVESLGSSNSTTVVDCSLYDEPINNKQKLLNASKVVNNFFADLKNLFLNSFNDVWNIKPSYDITLSDNIDNNELETQLTLVSSVNTKSTTSPYGIAALFNGAFERMLFFGPQAMIFFATYETTFRIITEARERHTLWFS